MARVKAKQYKDLRQTIQRIAQTRDEPVEGVVTALVTDGGGVPYRATVQIGDVETTVDILGWSHVGVGSLLSLESIGGLVSPRYRIREVLSRGIGVGSGTPGTFLNTPSIESLEAGTGLDPIPSEIYITPGGTVQARAVIVVNQIPEQYRQRQTIRYVLEVRKATGNQEQVASVTGPFRGWRAVGLVNAITAASTSADIGAIAGVTPQPDAGIPSRYGIVEIESEQIFYQRTNAAGTQILSLTRGYNSTTPASHGGGKWLTALTTTFFVNNLQPETAYEARVRAEAIDGRESTWSAWTAFTTVGDTTPPGWGTTPTPTTATSPYRATVTWTAADTDAMDLDHYVVEVSTDGGATWTAYQGSNAPAFELATTPGRSYQVRVKPVDTSGNVGSTSNAASFSTPLPVPLSESGTLAVLGGRMVLGPAATVLIADVSTGATTIDVAHNVLANGDRIYLEKSGQFEMMAVTSAATPISGGYRYSVTRNLDGTGANTWSAGDGVVSTGQANDLFMDIYATRGIAAATEVGPALVVNERLSATWNGWAPRAAVGNLNGLYGYAADTFGLAAGNPSGAWVGADPTNGFRIMNGAATLLQASGGNLNLTGNLTITGGGQLTVSNMTLSQNAFAIAADVTEGPNSWSKISWTINSGVNTIATIGAGYFTSDTAMDLSIKVQTVAASDDATLFLSASGGGTTGAEIQLFTAHQTPAQTEIAFLINGVVTALMNSSGTVQIGQAVSSDADGSGAALDIYDANAACIVMTNSLTDATNKAGNLLNRHYSNAEEPFTLVRGEAQSASNLVAIGGGASNCNAATEILFYTATTTTTLTGTERARIDSNGALYIGDTANAMMTRGLTINQGANDDEILALKSSDVSHTATNVAEADTYFAIRKVSAAEGGAFFTGFRETGTTALLLRGLGTADDTTKSAAARGYVEIWGQTISAGGATAPGANANVLVVRTGVSTTRFIVDAEGDLWAAGGADLGGDLKIGGNVGFYGTAPAAKPTVTGSRGGNAALASLLTALAGLGLLTDSTTA